MPFNSTNNPATPALGIASDFVTPQATFRQKCRRVLADGLYHSRLLHVLRCMERTRRLQFAPGSFVPQIRSFPASKFGILCYHRVGTKGVPYHSRLEPRIFEAQMRYLKKHYRIISVAQVCRELQDGPAVSPTLAITFDDGYLDLYTYAFPVLRELKIPATIYLIGDCLKTGEAPWYDGIFAAVHSAPGNALEVQMDSVRSFPLRSPLERSSAAWEIVCHLRSVPDADRRAWCQEFETRLPLGRRELRDRMLMGTQVREMFGRGISFGAHTMSHPSVSRLGLSALENELGRSRRFLETELDAEVLDFAYPFGKPTDCSLSAEKALSRFGYRSAVTTSEGINSTGANLLRLRRLQIGDESSIALFAFAVARLFLESVMETPHVYEADIHQRGPVSQTTGVAN